MYWKFLIPVLLVSIILTSGCVEFIEDFVVEVVEDNVQKFEISCPDYVLDYFEKEKTVRSDTSPFDEASDWHTGIDVPLLDIPVANKISCKMGDSDNLYCMYISPCIKEEGKYMKGKMNLIYSVEMKDSVSEATGYAIKPLGKYSVQLKMIDCKARTIIKDTLLECKEASF